MYHKPSKQRRRSRTSAMHHVRRLHSYTIFGRSGLDFYSIAIAILTSENFTTDFSFRHQHIYTFTFTRTHYSMPRPTRTLSHIHIQPIFLLIASHFWYCRFGSIRVDFRVKVRNFNSCILLLFFRFNEFLLIRWLRRKNRCQYWACHVLILAWVAA